MASVEKDDVDILDRSHWFCDALFDYDLHISIR